MKSPANSSRFPSSENGIAFNGSKSVKVLPSDGAGNGLDGVARSPT